MFTIEMLPAAHGDCLWLEYGPKKKPYRVLIDGGRDYSYKHLKARLEELRRRKASGGRQLPVG